ncbi:TPA: fructose PTS transporter subunit IIA [Enterococcus faecium]
MNKVLFGEQNIILDLDAKDKQDALLQMTKKMESLGVVSDTKQFLEYVKTRESYSTTGIGNGIAIPHGKGDVVQETSVLFARLLHPIQWDSVDGEPVSLIFLMAVPNSDAGSEHLKTLAYISGRLMDETIIQNLKVATIKSDIVNLFTFEQE